MPTDDLDPASDDEDLGLEQKKKAIVIVPTRVVAPLPSGLDPDVSGQKHFAFSPQGFQDIEDRRNEPARPGVGGPLFESGLREAGYNLHPSLRPQPAVLPPSADEPSTPMARGLGRDDIRNVRILHHALNLLDLLGSK